MKKFYGSTFAACSALAVVLTACATPTPAPTLSPATTQNSSTEGTSAPGVVTASVTVVPVQTSQMGFVISAPVKQIAVKAGDEVKAGQTLIVLNTPELELSVTGTEASVRSAQAEDQYWSFPRKNEPPERRWVSTAQLQEAQASLDAAKAILSQGTLVAPFDGTIVAINVAEGQLVQLGQVVAVIGDLNHLQVETTDLSERDIAGVQIGQTATVRLKAFNQDLAGKVTAIAPLGVKSSGDVVYKVTIELDAPPQGLMWGMSGDVDIQTK